MSTPLPRKFHISAILSVISGVMLTRKFGDIHAFLQFMTGGSVFTHQIGRAMDECKPHLLAQHPALEHIDCSKVDGDNWVAFIAEQCAKHGEFLDVQPLQEHAPESIDPVSELAEIIHPSNIIIAKVPA